jgi:hypothetical protein
MRSQHAKGIAVVAANYRFNLVDTHENLIFQYGRFSAAIA